MIKNNSIFSGSIYPISNINKAISLYNELAKDDLLTEYQSAEILSLLLDQKLDKPYKNNSPGSTQSMTEILRNALGNPHQKLFTYGSLMPGKPNHFMLEDYKGTWESVYTHGSKVKTGWGSSLGFDALKWDPWGYEIEGYLLRSVFLENSWKKLDEFEGHAYQRTLLPFFTRTNSFEFAFAYCASLS